jgi:hypothetical protein
MSLYSERLAKLKKEIANLSIVRKKKKKKWTQNQQIMINFINGVTKEAVFDIFNMKVILKRGNEYKGFQHILIKHYCRNCPGELNTMDIINFDIYLQRAIKLNTVGVSNSKNIVFQYIKGTNQYKIVLKEIANNKFVVTFYSVD